MSNFSEGMVHGPFIAMDYKKRIAKAREYMEEQKVEALLVKSSSNIFYLTGLLEIEGFFFLDKKGINLFVPELYYHECLDRRVLKDINVIIYKADSLEKFLKAYKKIAFIPSELPHSLFLSFRKRFKSDLVPLTDFLLEMRMLKEKGEIRLIKKALEINRRVFEETEKHLKEGAIEAEVAGEIHLRIRQLGGRKEAFEPIVASGPNSSYPHHKSGSRVIRKREPVVIDAGTDFCGYKSDLTRTLFCGGATKKFRELFQFMEEVLYKTVDFIQPGKTGKEIDSFARNILRRKKLEKYFVHGLGHGVGVDVHEKPVLNSTSEDVVKEGSVLTVEPGIYLPHEGGIRLEEMLIID